MNKAMVAQRTQQADKVFTGLSRNGLNGVVLYAEQGELVYEEAFGWRDLNKRHKDSIRIDAAFQLSSDSKMFTAEAVMLLKADGKLDYDDDIRKYIPEIPYEGVTIRHLLTHCSGLPRYDSMADEFWPDRKKPFSNEALIAMLAEKTPDPYGTPDGGYFEGHWDNDKRHGFGINLQLSGDDPRLHVGEWTKGRFQGERMKYTSERIYGIDISKYQHGKGRRPVPILWDKLRITNVGKRGSHNVSGTADYPVSFVFIKSTESTTIRNKFYVNDYAQARKRGIPIGAYHFWSMRTSGIDQAQHFLRNTLFKDGDLPPVLDIEPSKSQVEQMGADRMFMQIRIWLRAVERSTGVKPILYVNQMFVNNYLSKQPDLKRDYCVWIARYSEYKPDLRLAFWQLCPDGHVAGIQGDVDINVFNGYKLQFEKFLEEETIKR
jgi:GH25 family lysozyme M1 (1,4-beta-N-acetylmuramidase)